MRATSIVLTSVLCLSAAVAVEGFLIRSGDDADPAPDVVNLDAPDDAIDFDQDFDQDLAHGSLTGKLLVAAPGLDDPYFRGTVIYMLADDDDGSLGVVLNRPRSSFVHGGAMAKLWDGGPVGRDRVFVLHDDLESNGSVIVNGVAVAAEPSILDDIMEGNGPDHARVFVGYAGWGPGQLDRELADGAWLIADADPSLVVSDDTAALVSDAAKHAHRPIF